ncbi:related to extracellular serine-rich protein [Cephalotrichum gorgonifer]|uniref:Related to extracellular serine-rich protein n=1 Tax=Cephalotrichum gorgonifer TaxID=2041049 RepID=A0AAE8N6N8_9PEZI|nr:related to extracellular serine-rich protein [Cephalotrichum gorgonifer]
MHLRALAWGALIALQAALGDARTLSSTILILAEDDATAASGTSGLRGYGIPYEVLLVPREGAALPELTSSEEDGNYGGIVVLNEVGYDYDDGWRSALTEEQWDSVYEYQTSFGVRLVRLNVFPTSEFGVTTANPSGLGCCDEGVEQTISIIDDSQFTTARLKIDTPLSTTGLWHYPATITDDSIATAFAEFSPGGEMFTEESVAAVINNIDGREQMVFFMSWATDWSVASNYLQHAYIHWMTRGIFLGHRKIYLNTQVDDVHLDTPMFWPTDEVFRTVVEDFEIHKAWQVDINARLPEGSDYFMDLCHNGNGDIIVATDTDEGWEICDPNETIDYPEVVDPPLEFMKPPGTGVDVWPPEFQDYNWTIECCEIDLLAAWFMVPENRDAFAHVSHTFTHLELNNATYDDAWREIAFNRDWLIQVGIADGERFSPEGIVPPAITGLHNADVIRAWMDNGIKYVVGDNTRPLLRNSESDFWPKISNVEDNGHEGLVIVPRWATNIYYNCDTPECTTREWIETTQRPEDVTFIDLMDVEISTNVRYLLGLHHDPYMFHQANTRATGMDTVQIGDQIGKFSLLQIWVESITQELLRLTNWPIRSLKHDDIAHAFLDRMALDQCEPELTYTLSDDSTAITGVTITAKDNKCDVPIPATLSWAGSVGTVASFTVDELGNEPLVIWTTLSGEEATYTFAEPLAL